MVISSREILLHDCDKYKSHSPFRWESNDLTDLIFHAGIDGWGVTGVQVVTDGEILGKEGYSQPFRVKIKLDDVTKVKC